MDGLMMMATISTAAPSSTIPLSKKTMEFEETEMESDGKAEYFPAQRKRKSTLPGSNQTWPAQYGHCNTSEVSNAADIQHRHRIFSSSIFSSSSSSSSSSKTRLLRFCPPLPTTNANPFDFKMILFLVTLILLPLLVNSAPFHSYGRFRSPKDKGRL